MIYVEIVKLLEFPISLRMINRDQNMPHALRQKKLFVPMLGITFLVPLVSVKLRAMIG